MDVVQTRKQIEVEEKEVIRRERCDLFFASLFVCCCCWFVYLFVWCLMKLGEKEGKVKKPSSRELVSIVRQCICVFV